MAVLVEGAAPPPPLLPGGSRSSLERLGKKPGLRCDVVLYRVVRALNEADMNVRARAIDQ